MVESSIITLLPCAIPPSVHLNVRGPNSIMLFDEVLDSSTEVHLPTVVMDGITINVSLLIMVDSSTEGEISIEVSDVGRERVVDFR